MHEFKTLSNDRINIVGVINTTVKCNHWAAKDGIVTVVEDGNQPSDIDHLTWSLLFPQLRLSETDPIFESESVPN